MSLTRSRLVVCLFGLALLGMICTEVAVAQQRGQGRGGAGGRGPGGFGFGGGALVLLQRKDVQDELELLDDQKQQVTALAEKQREQIGELFRGAGGGGADNREAFTKLTRETQAAVDKLLLPHQAKRLKQIEVQSRLRGPGGLSGVIGGDTAEQLGVSEGDQEKIREKGRELEIEVAKKTAEVRRQLLDQLLANLSPEQRTKFKEMLGEPFTFKDEPGAGFGGFGGAGARGRGDGQQKGRRGNNN